MNKLSIIDLLNKNNIKTVLIGGAALNIYKNPRVSYDLDLAVKTLDVDIIIEILYKHDFYLISAVDDIKNSIALELTPILAKKFIETSKSGSATFIKLSYKPDKNEITGTNIDPENIVDILFELSIPIMRLINNAKKIRVKDIEIILAAKEDLLILKKNRDDKSASDLADIEFLKKIIAEEKD